MWSPLEIKSLLHLYVSPDPLPDHDLQYAHLIQSGLQ